MGLQRGMPLAQLGEPFGITPAAIENVSPGIDQCKDHRIDVSMRSEPSDYSSDATNTFHSSIHVVHPTINNGTRMNKKVELLSPHDYLLSFVPRDF
ncbi:hypothetical protein B9Z55_002321 [Caenorhabditis nigoni]|uniref:Uncharacterized protein n=1 Tax=Caenorhabditis nigoni TaxID=1611254 RepID=A0A2G5VK61_9PELO|nr:hypothetical protein B9Z55_002321 [Caenorhabditis nigoni]